MHLPISLFILFSFNEEERKKWIIFCVVLPKGTQQNGPECMHLNRKKDILFSKLMVEYLQFPSGPLTEDPIPPTLVHVISILYWWESQFAEYFDVIFAPFPLNYPTFFLSPTMSHNGNADLVSSHFENWILQAVRTLLSRSFLVFPILTLHFIPMVSE